MVTFFFFLLTNTKRNLISCTSKYTQNPINSYYLQRYRCSLNHHQLLPALSILTGLLVSTPHFHLHPFISFSMLTAKVMLLEKVKPFQYILKILDHFSLSFDEKPKIFHDVQSYKLLCLSLLYERDISCHSTLYLFIQTSPTVSSAFTLKIISRLSGFLLPKSIFYNIYPIHCLHSMFWHPSSLAEFILITLEAYTVNSALMTSSSGIVSS